MILALAYSVLLPPRTFIVQQCQSLESEYGTTYVKQCLEDPERARSVLAEAKVEIVRKDWLLFLDKVRTHSSLKTCLSPNNCLILVQGLGLCP